MQPPRPFRGASYDKDMFTFLPARANRNVAVESPRKRKSMASDHQIPTPSLNDGYVPSGKLNPREHADYLRGKELQSFVPASPRKSSKFSSYSDSAKCGYQNESGAPWHSNGRDFYESISDCHGYNSFPGPSQLSNHNDLPPLFQTSAGLTSKPTNWSPLVTGDYQRESQDSNSHTRGVEGFQFPKSQSYRLQNPSLMKVEGSDSSDLVSGESQILHQSSIKPVEYVVGSDEKSCYDQNYKVETSSNMQRPGDSSSIARVECTKLLENNASDSIYSIHEANSIIQQALKLLSAASDAGLIVNGDGSSDGCGDDSMTTPNSHNRNVSDSLNQGTLSRGSEGDLNLDKPIVCCHKGSVNIDDRLKSENGGSVLAEKLWDGTLQLSSTVVVSAIAFFKSGERMLEFSWSGYVEVKGKVRLEAFEKYVQDLPRARSRGLMVMSLRCNEGSSPAGAKDMAEVARKYKEGKKVGFAQLNKGVDMYICPHSDTVITILAKHGFFKGMSVVTEKSDPLLGCVVWRKNSASAPATKAAVPLNAPLSGERDAKKIPMEIGAGVEKNITANKSPEDCTTPCVTQPEESIIIPQNKSFTANMEITKPNVSLPPRSDLSTRLSDDEDLPEYDFRAPISQTVELASKIEKFRDNQTLPPIIAPLKSENYTVSQNLSIEPQQERHTGDRATSTRPVENIGNLSETKIPDWLLIEEKKPENYCHGDGTKNSKNLFDDDMPEWCPPGFKKMEPEDTEKVEPLFAQTNSMPLRSCFPDLATGHPFSQRKPVDHCHGDDGTKKAKTPFDDDMPEWYPPDLKKMKTEDNERVGTPFVQRNSVVPHESSFTDLSTGHRLPSPKLSFPQRKPVDDFHGDGIKNPKTLFDDDMPEWCPPDFKKMKPEYNNERVELPHINSMPCGSSFTEVATGRPLPSPPLLFTQTKPVDDYPDVGTKNLKSHFADGMRERCPPDFTTMKSEFNQRVGPPSAQTNSISMPHGSSFTDVTTGRQLPPPRIPPPPLPLSQPPLTLAKIPLPPPQPPLPPLPPPPSRTPPPSTPQRQVFDNNSCFNYDPSPVHLPPPPPFPPLPPPRPSPLTRSHFSGTDYPPSPIVNNFMHPRPVSPTHVRFQNQHYTSPSHPPPPVPEKIPGNSIMHASRAGPPMPTGDGFRHEFLPGLTPNPGMKPQFHHSGMNNHPHRSGWRTPRP